MHKLKVGIIGVGMAYVHIMTELGIRSVIKNDYSYR